jgi:hypothetical protein
VLEVREHTAGLEQVEDLSTERALALVLQMVDDIEETTASKRPNAGRDPARSCSTISTRS